MATTGSSLEADLAGIKPDKTPTNIDTKMPIKKLVKDSTTWNSKA